MKRRKILLACILVVIGLLVVVCTCPILRPVNVELQGAAYNTQDLQKIQDVTLRLKGHQSRYLLRDDALDVTLQLNDREMKFDDEPFYFPEEGLYHAYFHFYDPTRNHYISAKLAYDEDFSNVVVIIDAESVIYTASIREGTTLEDLPEPFVLFLDDYRN